MECSKIPVMYQLIHFTTPGMYIYRDWKLPVMQCLSQDLETGCLKLAVVNILGVQIFKGDHNILIFQP